MRFILSDCITFNNYSISILKKLFNLFKLSLTKMPLGFEINLHQICFQK